MSNGSITPALLHRVQQHAREWNLIVEESFETTTSVISFVRRNDRNLVLKLIKQEGDEWGAGEIVSAFAGNGVVRVYEHTGGAMVLERLEPGTPLATLALNGRDEEANVILASVIKKMSAREIPQGCPTVEDWGKAFEPFLANDGEQVPRPLVESAQEVFANLCVSQNRTRLLHGDLHHYNVLFDSQRGWLVIDPKGVVGELEYEIGAVLRNPIEKPELFLSQSTIERRLNRFANELKIDLERTRAWAFAQAVLSAIWGVEDGYPVDVTHPALKLAHVIQSMSGS